MSARVLAALLVLATACSGEEETPASEEIAATPQVKPQVVLETSFGEITLQLEPELAPETVENFLLHVRSGFYDGLTFHRVRKDFVIQAGLLTADMVSRKTQIMGVRNEAANGLKNLRGTLAMARTSEPHSATSEFFINLKDNPRLDFRESTYEGWGYAVFGRVVDGMDVVDAIGAVPTKRTARFEALPLEPVVIQRAYLKSDSLP
ncbi:MAG: peptidylprolyl isomerase [Rhodothermales bacterium]|nr:peptidylprolyl isomerase [Rhodothermales bacterium]